MVSSRDECFFCGRSGERSTPWRSEVRTVWWPLIRKGHPNHSSSQHCELLDHIYISIYHIYIYRYHCIIYTIYHCQELYISPTFVHKSHYPTSPSNNQHNVTQPSPKPFRISTNNISIYLSIYLFIYPSIYLSNQTVSYPI